MSANAKNIINLIKSGKMDLKELQKSLAGSASTDVSVEDWGVCYSSATGQLSEYCTVVAKSPNVPITGCGMIAYTNDGSSMLCVQYSNNFESTAFSTSIGTTLYNPNQGNQILCIVYGWTTQSNYYFTQTITVVPCQ